MINKNNDLHEATNKFLYFIDIDPSLSSLESLERARLACSDPNLWYEFEGDMDIIINDLENISNNKM
jgi:hypothetical protein